MGCYHSGVVYMVFYWGLYHLACILLPCRNMGGWGGGGALTLLFGTLQNGPWKLWLELGLGQKDGAVTDPRTFTTRLN